MTVPARWVIETQESRLLANGVVDDRAQTLDRAIKSRDQVIPDRHLLDCCVRIGMDLGILLTPVDLDELLTLYPFTRSKFVQFGGADGEVFDMVEADLAHAFLDASLPEGDDDYHTFARRLRFAAFHHGYALTAQHQHEPHLQ